MIKKRNNKRGQVWIETVLYTLIAFAMIGLVLAYAKPRIEEVQDKAVIEQSVEILEEINDIVIDIERVAGNQRVAEVLIKKGTMRINGVDDKITFEIESTYEYTESGEGDVQVGSVIASTQGAGSAKEVTLTSDYSSDYDIRYRGADETKIINRASTPYSFKISNSGTAGDKIIINFDV